MVLSSEVVKKHKQQLQFLLNMSVRAFAEATELISDVSQRDFSVSLVSLDLIGVAEVRDILRKNAPQIVYISQRVTSSRASDFLFLLSQQHSSDFIHALVKGKTQLSNFSMQEKEAFVEIGNIILNCILRHFSQKFDEPVNSYIPAFHQAHFETLIEQYVSENEKSGLFYKRLNIKFMQQEYPGYILWTDPGNLY